uniref:F-box domain-containing protein n=1 Tax=Caenorhabditis tropicalis TaxID=1561998 RepID=A0A1I7TBH6_9PELO
MSIDLQKLPYLAQKEVLSTMKLKEIFKLATLSKKNARLVKDCMSSQRFILTIFCTDDDWNIKREHEFYSEYTSIQCDENGIFLDKTVYEELEFIVDVFNKPKICINVQEDMEKFNNYARFLRTLGVNLFEVKVNRCKQGELQNMLETFKEVPEVHIYSCELEEVIQFDKTIRYQFDFIGLSIDRFADVKWQRDVIFSLIDCKRVLINRNSHRLLGNLIPVQDLKAFLELWMEGSRMEYFWTTAFDLSNFSTILKSLGQLVPVKAIYHFNGFEKRKQEFNGWQCYMIQQKNNGPKAIVFKFHNSVQLETDFE